MGEKVTVVAWQMTFANGEKVVFDSPMDPREVHDNGRPYYALMTVAQHERIVAGLVARLAESRELLQWYADNDDTNDGQPGNEFWLAGRDRAKAFLAQTAEGKRWLDI